MDWYEEYRIQSLKDEILKYEKLSEIGIEIYRENNDPDFLHKAIWFSNEAHKMKKTLKEYHGVEM